MARYHINLLPKQKKGSTTISGFVYFAVHYLRYIIILTQIVVIGVFFYRFTVDQEVIDLKESVAQKQEIIKLTFPLVEEASAIERKLNHVKTITFSQKQFEETFQYLASVIPEDMSLDLLNINQQSIEIEGKTTNLPIIKIFYGRLKKDEKFKSVQLNQIKKNESLFEFSFSIIR